MSFRHAACIPWRFVSTHTRASPNPLGHLIQTPSNASAIFLRCESVSRRLAIARVLSLGCLRQNSRSSRAAYPTSDDGHVRRSTARVPGSLTKSSTIPLACKKHSGRSSPDPPRITSEIPLLNSPKSVVGSKKVLLSVSKSVRPCEQQNEASSEA